MEWYWVVAIASGSVAVLVVLSVLFYKSFFKRLFDVFFSGIALIVLSPILLVVAFLVRIKLGVPVIFKQERPGKIDSRTGLETIFTLYKFRTMTDARDEKGNLLPASKRLTHFGKKLRATSLDELPELINIIKGDMSIVGPRPLLVKYLPLYNDKQHRRHLVRPGLTGYAQANGRNALSWEERFDMDVEYVDRLTLMMDAKIIIQTIKAVFKHEGIGGKDEYIIGEFQGSNKQ